MGSRCSIAVPLTMVTSKNLRSRSRCNPARPISGASSVRRWLIRQRPGRSGVSQLRVLVQRPLRLRRQLQLRPQLRRQHQHRARSLRITRAFHQLHRSSTALEQSGRVHQAARSCAMVSTRVAQVHRFFTARASFMRLAPTRSGGVGPAVDGYRSEPLILVAVVQRQLQLPRLHRRRSPRITHAFHPRFRSSTATAQSGRGQQTERSCAMAPALVAQVRRFFTALASCMCLAPTRSGGVGPAVDG